MQFMEVNQVNNIDFNDSSIAAYTNSNLTTILDKKHIVGLRLTIDNIAEVLKAAFTKYHEAKDKDIIVAVGNTGCGKSTMLTSLIYGTDMLKSVKLVEQIEVP